jgi:hypothetical protein
MKDLVDEILADGSIRPKRFEYRVIGNICFLEFADAFNYARRCGKPYKTKWLINRLPKKIQARIK